MFLLCSDDDSDATVHVKWGAGLLSCEADRQRPEEKR